MATRLSKRKQESEYVITYARLEPEDHAELKRREEATGAPMSAQIRIIVRDALRGAKGKVLR